MLEKLITAKREAEYFMTILLGVNEYIAQGRWQAEVGNISKNEWKMYFRSIKQWHEVKLRDFQYNINNKILVTNSFLFEINKIDCEKCPYCMEQPEKNYHLFVLCPKVRSFWTELRAWLSINTNLEISIEERKILFSYTGKEGTKELHLCLS